MFWSLPGWIPGKEILHGPRLTDQQQPAVLRAANPLECYQREAFLTALALP